MSCMSAILSGGELLEQTTTQADWGIKKDSDEIQMHEAIPEPGSSLGSHFVLCAGPQVFISALLIFSSFHENRIECILQGPTWPPALSWPNSQP